MQYFPQKDKDLPQQFQQSRDYLKKLKFNFKSWLLLSNKSWQDPPEAEESPEFANLILKPFQLGKTDGHAPEWVRIAVLLLSSPIHAVWHCAVHNVVTSHGFCIMEECHNFWGWRGILHSQLFPALPGSESGESSYCLSALFSWRLSIDAIKQRCLAPAQIRKIPQVYCCCCPWKLPSPSRGGREVKQGMFFILNNRRAL